MAAISAPQSKEQEKRYLDNMNVLDLELSQSQALWKKFQKEEAVSTKHANNRFGSPERGAPQKVGKGYLDRGEFLESLDLNIGFESIKKLQDDWFKPIQKRKDEKFERDSLDSDDEGENMINKKEGTNTEWLDKSIKQSVC